MTTKRTLVGLGLVALTFVALSGRYLYHFVDDEAITLRYAQNLLDGHGLAYNAGEPAAEGISNLFHVAVMALLLAATRLVDFADHWALAAGSAWSLSCGLALVLVTWTTVRRMTDGEWPAAVAAAIATTAGPLLAWSASSLETVPFSLAWFVLIAASMRHRTFTMAAAAAVAVLGLRIDGFVWVGAWLAARLLTARPDERRAVITSIAVPAILAFAAITAWRFWYFDHLLSLPLATKVLHKLVGADAAVVSAPATSYLRQYAAVTGSTWLIALALLCAVALGRKASRRFAIALVLVTAGTALYVNQVRDWMIAFRFLVPLVAPVACLAGLGVAAIGQHRRMWAVPAGVAAIGLACLQVPAFAAYYTGTAKKPDFWSVRQFDGSLKFGEWHEAYALVASHVTPDSVLSFHDAGLVPFLAGVPNIDPLGLCDEFVGRLPSRDPIFTDVGRYYPLTHRPPSFAAHAYLLAQDVDLLMMRKSWVQTANHGRIPAQLMRGYFEIAQESPRFVLYRRTARPLSDHRREERGFLENVLHPGYASEIVINDRPVPEQDQAAAYAAITQPLGGALTLDPVWRVHSALGTEATVFEWLIEAAASPAALRITVTIRDAAGRPHRLFKDIAPRTPIAWHEVLPAGIAASRVDVSIASFTGQPTVLEHAVVHVMGQTPALLRHLRRHAVSAN